MKRPNKEQGELIGLDVGIKQIIMKNLKVNEIRVCNWVWAEVGMPSLEMHQILANDFISIDRDVEIFGLPLLDMRLKDFGFNSGNTIDTYYRPDWGQIYLHRPHRDSKHWLVKASGDVNITSIEFVHQLQNFHHSICGQEL